MVFALHYKEIGKRYTGVVVSMLFVLLFIYAAVSKLLDFETFTVQLAQSPLLSAYAGIIAWLVPGIEITIAFLLMVARFRTLALYAAFTLMVMFTAYIFIILNFSDFIPCSCGGVLEKLSWTQHFIFNIVFMLLAGVAVFLFLQEKPKKTLLMLATLAIIGIGIVTLLFAFSEKKMHRNNAFQRRYVPRAIKKTSQLDLEYDSYYIAGMTTQSVYLGNVTAPLNILELDTSLNRKKSFLITLEDMELPYKNITVQILPPKFYVSDGTVPIVLEGNLDDWEAKIIMKDKVYFTLFVATDTTQFVMRTIDGKTRENTIAKYVYSKDTLIKNTELLQKQVDGIFDTDGQLLANAESKQYIYVYYYRNQYIQFDSELKLEGRQKTMDTITQANLEIAHLASHKEYKLNRNAVVVNRQAATNGKYLFILSDRLGKYEDAKILNEASIIDVYNIENSTYSFSFYVYNFKKSKISSFAINQNFLYTLTGDYIVRYKLNEEYFK